MGSENKFGHPNKEVLTRIEEQRTRIFRTDKMGEIIIKSDGEKIKIENYVKMCYN